MADEMGQEEDHPTLKYMWSDEVRTAVSILETVFVLSLSIRCYAYVRSAEKKQSGQGFRVNVVKDFYQETKRFVIIYSLTLYAMVFNATNSSTCGLVYHVCLPSYHVAKYVIQRIIYSKASVFDIMQECSAFMYGLGIHLNYILPILLAGYGFFVCYVPKMEVVTINGREVCIGKADNHSSASYIVIASTVIELGTNLASAYVLAYPIWSAE
mmetsp:Transcript_7886/g.15455  ORF Transcript_7886/g.15455 Transcript_7886/m.15455 type:complete len:212 (+) Transcript_7886:144-779(+)|eukprot:CAMPEP_0170171868 /NCGR_PEP_ID=MMETSP0040_2-20121228/5080_1 /TAXON_ID=641309 /ORGANISM="Lotharella oceanica, Strain CCMP622" /LENGTH=211 /DNA_ID=CAMNT_0010412193 /DNA_START=104 /DNA_END=739 /DNA_ORIENTATION=+